MSQSKLSSFAEAVCNTLLGLAIAVVATQFICYVYDIPMSYESNLVLSGWLTVISIVRSYLVRRLWNNGFRRVQND